MYGTKEKPERKRSIQSEENSSQNSKFDQQQQDTNNLNSTPSPNTVSHLHSEQENTNSDHLHRKAKLSHSSLSHLSNINQTTTTTTTAMNGDTLNLVSKQIKLNSSSKSALTYSNEIKQRQDTLNSNLGDWRYLKAKSTQTPSLSSISNSTASLTDFFIRPSFYLFPNSRKHEANHQRVIDDDNYNDENEEIDEDSDNYNDYNDMNQSNNGGLHHLEPDDLSASKSYLSSLHLPPERPSAKVSSFASSFSPTFKSSFTIKFLIYLYLFLKIYFIF